VSLFAKAERQKAYARIAIDGPSGAGKTHSALKFAKGLCETPEDKIFVICSEQGSCCLEEGKPGIPDFMVARLDPPYTPKRYIEYINAAVAEGAKVIIVDSISHAWAGKGGVLEIVDKNAGGSGNKFAAWRTATPQYNELVDALLQAPCHVVVTLRTKTDYVQETNDRGKVAPKKIGLAPVMREGFEYEFTIVLDVDQERHLAKASKDRTSLFDGEAPFLIDDSHGEALRKWLENGVDAPVKIKTVPALPAQYVNRLTQLALGAGYADLNTALDSLGILREELTVEKAGEVAETLKSRAA
jgi:hypothetical protein